MFKAHFKNCYGIQYMEIPEINFSSEQNILSIYAPNGVMKSSLAHIFEDLCKGEKPKDRVFHYDSEYLLQYRSNTFDHTSVQKTDAFYVVNSFDDKFTADNASIATLLANDETKEKYTEISNALENDVKNLTQHLTAKSGISKSKVKESIATDYFLSPRAEWLDILNAVESHINTQGIETYSTPIWESIKYLEVFNKQTEELYKKPEFKEGVEQYIDSLNKVISSNPLFENGFTDYNADNLTKSLAKNNLFNAHHEITLQSGEVFGNLEQWQEFVAQETKKIYNNPKVEEQFRALKGIFSQNIACDLLRELLREHRQLIYFLKDTPLLKRNLWAYCILSGDFDFNEYLSRFNTYKESLNELHEIANSQRPAWERAIREFNSRFHVPFSLAIGNQDQVILHDSEAEITYHYHKNRGFEEQESVEQSRDGLMQVLSLGEQRALYLLNILFDIENILFKCSLDGRHRLLIFDDVADSFDYKNKYAIIEYLSDIAKNPNIDILLLTHNYDFYRTVQSRLDIDREYCLIAQKTSNAIVVKDFKYLGNYFKQGLIRSIKDGRLDDEKKKMAFVAGIPFYRNIMEYVEPPFPAGKPIYNTLTSILHIKKDTDTITIGSVWTSIAGYFNLSPLQIPGNEIIVDVISDFAKNLASDPEEHVHLDTKLILTMDIRLTAESFLKGRLVNKGIEPCLTGKNQTRAWSNQALEKKDTLSDDEKMVINRVNVITPETIHLNSFMFEPLIDISDETLKQLYRDVHSLVP